MITRGKITTSLLELSEQVGVYVDEDDLLKFGTLSSYIDDQHRIKVSLGSREKGKMFLHSLVMNTDKPVDHINNNQTDNRKVNLRIVTLTQNQGNRAIGVNNKTGYKGVSTHSQSSKYRARISTKTGEINLGMFTTKEEAALAYNKAAVIYFGEFAKLNEVSK